MFDIYASDRNEPNISLTYTKNEHTGILETFKVWIKKGRDNDYEMMNYANVILFYIWVFNAYGKHPVSEKDIWRFYQRRFGDKLWNQPKVWKEQIKLKSTLNVPPHKNFVEMHENDMQNFVNNEYKTYIQKYLKEK